MSPNAHAQVLERWLTGTPLRESMLTPSQRLAAMGGLTIAVDDEDAEITLLDYGHNYAGLLEDRATSSADVWLQRSPWDTDLSNKVDFSESQGFLTFRTPGRQAVGVRLGREETSFRSPSFAANDLRWAVSIAQVAGAINGVPRTDPNPDTVYNKFLDANMNPLPIDSSLTVDGSRPSYGLIYNKQFGARISFAASEMFRSESERAGRVINYVTEYESKSWDTGLGLAITPLSGVVIGGRVNHIDTRLRGLANGLRYRASSAHYDLFEENLPVWQRGAHMFVTLGTMLRGAVAYDRTTASGNETYELNWGDLIALQRTGGSIQARGTRFRDRMEETGLHTRWTLRPNKMPLQLAAAYDRTEGSSARRAASDPSLQDSVITARIFGNSVVGTTVSAATFGGSVRLGDGATVGLEYATGKTSVTDSLAASPVATDATLHVVRAGVEMRIVPALLARAGYSRASMPDSHDRITRLTGGAGYALSGRVNADLLVSFANSARDVDVATTYRLSDWSRTLALTTRLAF